MRHPGFRALRPLRSAPHHPDRVAGYPAAASIRCFEPIPPGRIPSSPCLLSGGSPANRRKCSANCARPLTPVITTSTMVKDGVEVAARLELLDGHTGGGQGVRVGGALVTQRIDDRSLCWPAWARCVHWETKKI